MKHERFLRYLLLTLLVSMLGVGKAAAAEAYAVFEGTTLTFNYDNSRSTRSGVTYDLNVGENDPGWYKDKNYKKVERVVFSSYFANARPTSTYCWFSDMDKLRQISDIQYLNTSEVTTMRAMFFQCKCEQALDVTFNTDKVVDINNMFAHSGFKALNLNLSTGNVKDMCYMFQDCKNLEVLDLTTFNTSNVEDMTSMFQDSPNLKTVYVGEGWNVSSVKYYSNMFSGCSSIVGGAGTKYDANNTTKDYAHVDGGSANPGYLTLNDAYAIYENPKLTFYCDNKSSTRTGTKIIIKMACGTQEWIGNTDLHFNTVYFDASFANVRLTSLAHWFEDRIHLRSVTGLGNLNTSNVTKMDYMFNNCNDLTDIDLSTFDTHNVIIMDRMFSGCNKLGRLDLSSFDTRNVGSMYEMFVGCSKLEFIDLTGFNTQNVQWMDGMFDGCSALRAIYVGDGWSTAKVTSSTFMFGDCTNLEGGQGTNYDSNHVDKAYAHVDGGTGNPGYLTLGSPYAVFANGTLSFYFDKKRSTRGGKTYMLNVKSDFPDWSGVRESVTKVVFDPSFAKARPTTAHAWLYFMPNLQSFEGMEYFNTSKVTDMVYMFYNYKQATLDISSFNTSNVTNMSNMFMANYNLKTIYVGDGWDTSNVTLSTDMFKYSTQLVGGQGTTYDESNVDKAYAHVDGGPANPGYFTLVGPYAEYNNGTLMFHFDGQRNTREGRTYDINHQGGTPEWENDGIKDEVTAVVFDPSFAKARPKATHYWFSGMTNLVSITGMAEYLNTSEALYMTSMFSACRKLKSVDLSGFDTGKVMDMKNMFNLCESMETLDLTSFNTENVKDMSSMFWSASSLKTVDLSSFNTAKVTNMEKMFERCRALTSIYAGEDWNTDNVTNSYCMFRYCDNLVGGAGTKYTSGNWDKTYACIDGGTDSPGYLTMRAMYAVLDGETLTFYYDGTYGQRTGEVMTLDQLFTITSLLKNARMLPPPCSTSRLPRLILRIRRHGSRTW